MDDGTVRQVQFGPDRVTARVSDTQVCRVKIWRARGELHFSCSCPTGRDDAFCKHCVAVGLTWVQSAERTGSGAQSGPAAEKGIRAREKLQRHLRAMDRDRLAKLLLEATDYDDILRRRLMMELVGVTGIAPTLLPDFVAYRQILQDAIDAPDYVDYDAMPDYVHGVAEAIHPLGDLLRTGHAATVMDLVELALTALDRASENVDASDGSLNAVYDDLQNLHLQASRAAAIAPETLAARLLHFELEGGLGVFNNATKTYEDVLGPAGLAAWRKLLIREWSQLPTLGAGERGGVPSAINHRRFQIQALMETMAVAEGDLETLAAIKQKDLSSPHDFLSLAEWHQTAGHPDDAISWAERGLAAFADPLANAGLREFLAAAYQTAGRHAEATVLAWDQFSLAQTLEQYHQLKQSTRQTAEGWPTWRERALRLTRENLDAKAARHRERGGTEAPDRSVLVEFLLDDAAIEDAWSEAKSGGCRTELWLQLAELRAPTHPADSLEIYRSQLGPTIAQGGPRAYREAIVLLTKISVLLEDMAGRRSLTFSGRKCAPRTGKSAISSSCSTPPASEKCAAVRARAGAASYRSRRSFPYPSPSCRPPSGTKTPLSTKPTSRLSPTATGTASAISAA